MKTYTFLIFLFLCSFAPGISAQVAFIVQSFPANTPPQDNLYIAGDFTGWQPGLTQYKLQKNGDGKWNITIPAQTTGTVIKFKFTRGSWETVEKGPGGEEIADRIFTFGNGNTVNITISNWAGGGSTSTAAANVKIMSTDFFMPQLNRTRRIWIYYPPGYETSGISYPVLYMHDGQNLFDASTAFSGEWKVDETLNNLASQGKLVPLVVGIDNGSDRMSEYTPWSNSQYGGGNGEKYMQFIVETLKPYIDQHYRTLPGRENTGIMGSSLGGLISHYGSLKYQETFSKAGIFSPSYWFADSLWVFTHAIGKQQDLRIYQYCGSAESSGMVADMKRMNDSLVKIGFAQDKIFNKVVPGGLHNESYWSAAFGEAYLWLFDSFTSSTKELAKTAEITCFPNPVYDMLTFRTDRKIIFDTIRLIDMKGSVVKTIYQAKENTINVHDLQPGTYVLKGISGKIILEGRFIKK